MGNRILDIVITHYDEPYEIVRPCIDMLRHQKGFDYSKFRVTLIHDGSEKFHELENDPFPFEFREIVQEHKGVSATRNHGIDIADAQWITFFDCDDCLSSIYSIAMILSALENDDRFNLMWHQFYFTIRPGIIELPGIMNFFNLVWMCAKYFRLSFLKDRGIRFNEELEYSEDGSFDKFVYLECAEGEIGEIKSPFPLYAWLRRPNSATTDRDKLIRNVLHAFRANKYVSELFKEHNRDSTGLCMARTITDAYVSMTRKSLVGRQELNDISKEVSQFIHENENFLNKVTKKEWEYVLNASEIEARSSLFLNPYRPLFDEWYEELKGGNENV